MAAAIDWLYDPGNREEATAILIKALPKLTPALAQQTYAEALDPHQGFFRKAAMDVAGIETVLALRSAYAEPKKALTDPMKYYDPSYWDAAMQ